MEYNPRRVSITLGYELPQHEEQAITRSLASNDEYKVSDFYLLIFQNTDENDANADPVCVFAQYYKTDSKDLVKSGEYDAQAGSWVSIETEYNNSYGSVGSGVNSTYGQVTIEPELDPDKNCFIFGFANVDNVDATNTRVEALVSDPTAETTTYITPKAVLDKFNSSIGGESPMTLSQLRDLKIQINNLSTLEPTGQEGETLVNSDIVNREHAHLLYSGQWSKWTTKREGEDGRKHNVFDAASLSGEVDLTSAGSGNNYDLRSKGMIYLRCMIAHVSFNITVDNTVFDSFVPESWQVVHVPYNTYFIDQVDETATNNNGRKRTKITGDDYFGKITPVTKMIHDEDTYQFDFYMLENVKDATSTDNIDYTGNKKADISGYYEGYFGEEISTLPKGPGPDGLPNKLDLVYGGDQNKFLYAKRELELKYTSVGDESGNNKNQVIWNTTKYQSKKFVYSEPKATYVIIKGRLLINKDVDLKNLAGVGIYNSTTGKLEGVEEANIGSIRNGYADVIYTIHLGYAKNKPTDTKYDETDFSILRNVDYVYNVQINGINSIITNVKAHLEKKKNDSSSGIYRVKAQPGADGHINLAMENIYNTDSHFNQFNFMLEKSALSDFSFDINTPWSHITSEDVKADIEAIKTKMINEYGADYYGIFAGGGYKEETSPGVYKYDEYDKYANNPDFNWFKFTPAYDQRGMFDAVLSQDDNNNRYRKYRKTVKYDKNTVWNLFDFMVSMDGLTASDDQVPEYNEGINQGSDTDEAYRRKIGKAIKERIYTVLYGNPEGVKEGSQTVFECEVSDANGDYAYTRADVGGGSKQQYTKTSGSALPFLMDIRKFKVTQEKYNFIKTIYDAVIAGIDNGTIKITDDTYFNKFKRPFIDEDGNYCVEENYVQFLKETDPFTFGDNDQIGPIRRMFYTAYVDEYFYSTPPSGQSWSAPYWKQFVNQPARYITFGYRGDSGIASSSGADWSTDGESSITYSSITILQSSIQTFYSTSGSGTYALGVEHVNETRDPRWTDQLNEIKKDNLSHSDGWENARRYVVFNNYKNNNRNTPTDWTKTDGNYSVWDTYVSETVYEGHNSINGLQSNVTMRSNPYYAALSESDRMGDNGVDTKRAYLAGAIRMCMNRNRDENGNGKIDEEELKWYLPTSDQMDAISLCHYSLTDPLFNYNTFYGGDVNHQRLPESNLRGKYLYKYHYATSDYYIFPSEEMMVTNDYSKAGEIWASHPYEMRCVRNMNNDPSDNSTPSKENVRVFSYDSSNHTFTMDKLDSRSIRNVIYHMHELPSPHYLFSRDNLPYSKFKVARDNKLIKYIVVGNTSDPDYPTITGLSSTERKVIKNVVEKKPCAIYYEESDKSDQGTWRAPNAAELGLMVMQLRTTQNSNNGYYTDNNVDFFWEDATYSLYTGTSWNFTGPWGRVTGLKDNGGNKAWKIQTSDVKGGGNDYPNKPANESFPESTDPMRSNGFLIRCVKDLAE